MSPALDLGLTVLARAPEPGRVKTRLARTIGDAPAAELHLAMTLDVLGTVTEWLARRASAVPVLAWTGRADAAGPLLAAAQELGVVTERQPEGDLGERIAAAVDRRLDEGRGAALVFGSDAPLLPDSLLDSAASALEQADVGLGPSPDGGFVVLASRRALTGCLGGVGWGGETARSDTERVLREAGLTVAGCEGAEDVDEQADLERLAARLAVGDGRAPRTAAWLVTGPGRVGQR
ncbi:MAG: TIGR04282 family arsenosugar biosynthesis glycosyltransferase [Acidobacteriota bacterium]